MNQHLTTQCFHPKSFQEDVETEQIKSIFNIIYISIYTNDSISVCLTLKKECRRGGCGCVGQHYISPYSVLSWRMLMMTSVRVSPVFPANDIYIYTLFTIPTFHLVFVINQF